MALGDNLFATALPDNIEARLQEWAADMRWKPEKTAFARSFIMTAKDHTTRRPALSGIDGDMPDPENMKPNSDAIFIWQAAAGRINRAPTAPDIGFLYQILEFYHDNPFPRLIDVTGIPAGIALAGMAKK